MQQGALTFLVDEVDSTIQAGEAIEVPPGAVHQVHNAGEVAATAVWQTRPALRTAEFHLAIAAAGESGDVARLMAAVEEYSDVFALAPQPVGG